MNRLFVYGTLAPGKPNEHVLADLDGTWEPATIRGTLHTAGWGAVSGFPVIILDAEGDIIKGQIFRSAQLASYWHVLDEFEGDAYKRELAEVELADGNKIRAFVYTFNEMYQGSANS
ncbi:MAG: gamma-glutamylcyclotransferase [Gammaproteobacteria bacterium]|nr:gamma-glutamylcyclotransferase [Gammaproteobacteria bacterium]MDD9897323.1 gamma-glutamylcyclotransferase [Gammaproteobacteria bacterium]MDD9959431.1 gamma-glutamylcyclotransferase [Gammaproteobacteria bacterium]